MNPIPLIPGPISPTGEYKLSWKQEALFSHAVGHPVFYIFEAQYN